MKKFIYIGLLKLKLLAKDKLSLAAIILTPIIFISVLVIGFGSSTGSSTYEKYPIGIVNNDNGKYSKLLIKMMKNDNYFDVTESNYANSRKDVETGKLTMSFVIPKNFSNSIQGSKTTAIDMIKLQDNENTSTFGIIVKNYIYQLSIGETAKKASSDILISMKLINENKKNEIENNIEKDYLKNIETPKNTYILSTLQLNKAHANDDLSTTAIGIMVMFIMFFVSLGAGSILEEKEFGTWTRTISTPTRNRTILCGYVFGNFLIGWIQVAILILFSKYVFNLNWGNSPLGIILLFSCFLLASIGLGTALSSLVKSKKQLNTLTPIVVIPTCLLAGCMWPRDIMSGTMLKISNFVPQTWVIKGSTDLITRDLGISSVFTPCLVLLIFSIVFFMLGLWIMHSQKD
ncbi:ABC transporter permease [Clostridium estertheticum]|uniref:ABC transporter permease n=1 Tax=Clostridium estertheticum TaxID=238834 RepID=UPI001C6E8984|nr:ABC transporter permease [Clostridium estertheticum]MBW9154578.1 ABC transporter permease [Clostridium estertheticum]WLC83819.1 ABC transporter permease [Clostridium estertheticum]